MKRFLYRGFTLAELLIVVAIISLLASVSYVQFNQGRAQARDERRISDVEQIALAVRLYYEKFGEFPCEGGGSACNFVGNANGEIGNGGTIDGLIAPFLEKVPADPLGPGDPTYYYYYDGDASCGNQVVIHAIEMEVPASGNWSTVCGSDNDGSPTSATYTVVVGGSSG